MSQELEEIKHRIDIVELIGQYLKLQKAGRNYKALCPFHSEKTPSFNVSPELQIFKCFGCQKGGDIFTFYQEIEGVEFSQAVKDLAERAGVKLSSNAPRDKAEESKSRLEELNQTALKFFAYFLEKHNCGQEAREYLKKREIKQETIKQFSLGYAPKSWNSLGNYLLKKGYSLPEIIKTGLVSPGKVKPGWYDRFRGRVIFPLFDQRDRLVGFTGRVLDKSTKEAKYVNTPETPLFSKSRFLYGLNHSKIAIKTNRKVIVVEGQFDMITPFQNGTLNIIASGGTALTNEQLRLIKRYADEILLAYDGDSAGVQASWRGVQLAKDMGLEVKVVNISQGKDPDDFARNDPTGWKKAIENAEPAYDFYIRSAAKNADLNKAEDRRRVGEKVLPIIVSIPDQIEQDYYLKKLGQLLKISEDVGRQALLQTKTKSATRATANLIPNKKEESISSKQEHFLNLSLNLPWKEVKIELENLDEKDFNKPAHKLLLQQLKELGETNITELDLSSLRDKLEEQDKPDFDRLVFLEDWGSGANPGKSLKDLRNTAYHLKINSLKRQLKQTSQKIQQAEQEKNTTEAKKWQEQAINIQSKLANYAKKESL